MTADLGDVLDGYELDWEERFAGPELDRSRWLPHHLPQWSSRAQSAARYELGPDGLVLLVDADQGPWCPELDGATRVSSLQTGVFAGPIGSRVGQHRFHAEAVVREEQEEARLYTPLHGLVVLRARATPDPEAMVALWMIGFEDEPERSGEICVCEIFGRDVGPASARVGMGVHPFGDPALVDEWEQVELPIDATEPHEYAAEWTPEQVVFYVDGAEAKRVGQSPAYPMQLMLGLYAFGSAGPHPKRFEVEWLRWHRPRPGIHRSGGAVRELRGRAHAGAGELLGLTPWAPRRASAAAPHSAASSIAA